MITKLVWLRNKEGGQTIGNQQIVRKVTKKDWRRIKPLLADKNITYEQWKKKYGTGYVSLIKKDSGKWKLSRIRKSKSTLIPKQKKYYKVVKSFKSKKAKEWRRTADSDLKKKKRPVIRRIRTTPEPNYLSLASNL